MSQTGRSGAPSKRQRGFLARLARDSSGNTLAIVGAALIPLTAIIGSGVDMSRAYMAETRLQSACDAAALAGRRVMENDTLDDNVRNEATRFFNFNFPQGLYQTAAFTPTVTRPSSGTVRVDAETTIPTTVMSLFGFETLPLDVTCDASLNFVNTDVLLVLDVTGSMASALDGTPKIQALREAVMALYDELAPVQAQLEANGLRLRYGVVPYSSTVNVGELLWTLNPDYIAPDHDYRSRIANYNTATYVGTTGTPQPPVEEIYNNGASITQRDCDRFGQNRFSSGPTRGGGPAPAPTWTRSYSNDETPGVDWGWPGARDNSSGRRDNRRSCRRRYVQTDTTYETRYKFTNWVYVNENYDLSGFRQGQDMTVAATVRDASGNEIWGGSVAESGTYDADEIIALATDEGTGVIPMQTTPLRWNGCIEERATVDDIRYSSGYDIPDGAYDLNINLIPDQNDDATMWRPMIPELYWRQNSSGSYTQMTSSACPAKAKRLQAWTRTAMQTYVDALQPTGNTYHDIGMIWGARLISNGGIFADSTDTFNDMPVARHIIFMTDGQLEPSATTYSSYGVETNDKKVTGSPTASGQYESHMQRFRMICNAAKNLNASIWVIAFGTTLSTDMQSCASNPNQASTSANRDQLIAQFREIGSNIGALRLTQ